MKRFSILFTLLLAGVAGTYMGCAPKAKEVVVPSTGTAFTAADIAKTWNSSCITKTDAIIGTGQVKLNLVLNSDGTFSFSQYTYTAPSGAAACAGGDYKAIFSVSGTYTVGSTITGGQALNFTTTSASSLMVLVSGIVATQNAFNTDCGGTSPYCTLSGGSCTNNGTASGVSKNSSNMLCQNYTFPANGATLYNVASWDGTILSIGANTTGIPGVFSAGSIPSSATITLY